MRVPSGFLYLIIAGLVGFIIVDRLTDTRQPSLIAAGESGCATEISALQKKIKILEDDHQRLHKRNLELLAHDKNHGHTQPLPAAQSVVAEQADIEQLVAERQAEMDYARSFSNTFQHKMATIPGYNIAVDLEQQFDKQSIDTEWSIAQESQLQELFHNHDELRQFALESIQCRTDGCRVKILFAEPQEIDLAREALTGVLTAAEPRILPSVVIAVPYPETNRVDLYIARTADRQLFQ